MSQVNFNSTSSITATDLGPSSSLQLMFAKLQLELSETAKSQALERMESISEQQEEQKLVSSLLNEARQSQADAKAGVSAGSESVTYSNGKTEKNTKNWEFSRLAFMDVVLMQVALAEILTFPSIPLNVTFNEYLDLAKVYSTPRSAAYINGMLDHIVKQLREEKKLLK